MKTLILTPWYTPFLIVKWETAVVMQMLGKADLVEAYEGEMCHSPSVSVPIPAVLRQRKFVNGVKRGVKFSQTNVFTRDRFTCQYCGERHPPCDLNYDHVIPKSKGGRRVWENIVTSCFRCNTKKRNRTPEEAGMPLLSKPVRPLTLPLASLELDAEKVPEPWFPYARRYAESSRGLKQA